MWRRTPDADDRPPDATGGCRRDAAWMPPPGCWKTPKLWHYRAAVAPLASWMPATPRNVHTLTGMRLCGGAAACGVVTAAARGYAARRRQNRRKVVGDKPRILSLVVLMKPLGLFSRELTLTQEKSCILPIGGIHKQRRGMRRVVATVTSKPTKSRRRRQTAQFWAWLSWWSYWDYLVGHLLWLKKNRLCGLALHKGHYYPNLLLLLLNF